jgi:hypothetical protein
MSWRSAGSPPDSNSNEDFALHGNSVVLSDREARVEQTPDECARHFLRRIAERHPAWIGLWVSSRAMEQKNSTRNSLQNAGSIGHGIRQPDTFAISPKSA